MLICTLRERSEHGATCAGQAEPWGWGPTALKNE